MPAPKKLTPPAAPKKSAKPEKKFGPFAGGVGVCIWQNQVDTDDGPKTFRSVTINPRRYLDRESNQWKDAQSFNPADLPALIFALNQALRYSYETPVPGGVAADEHETPNGDDVHF